MIFITSQLFFRIELFQAKEENERKEIQIQKLKTLNKSFQMRITELEYHLKQHGEDAEVYLSEHFDAFSLRSLRAADPWKITTLIFGGIGLVSWRLLNGFKKHYNFSYGS